MTTQSEAALASATDFIERVKRLSRGELAALRRNAGNTLPEARGVAWFYRLLDDEGYRNLEVYFLVATLVGLNPYALRGDFGVTMRAVQGKANPEGVERRFCILLDADWETPGRAGGGELPFRLRQLVKLAAAHQVGVDWAQLLVDLGRWHWQGKRVQRQWAESFYAPYLAAESAAAASSPDETHR